jgi:8-oxo-dGTP pyrophosphatase MutT (NUDIX family)
MSDRPPVTAVPAATILLVRDGSAGLEVFMLERHRRIDFATGALVFPGGKVEPGDADPALAERCAGAAGLDADRRALRVAAIRETFEECGVLLTRPRGESGLVRAERLDAIAPRWRDALLRDRAGMAELARAEELELACDLLVHYAHWITPEFMPKRFDTHFFLVAAPPDQAAAHDGAESVDSLWTTPQAALAEAEAGRRTIIFPTLLNLRKLGRSPDVAAAVARARSEPVVTVLPRPARGPRGTVVRIPPEAGYGISEAPVDDPARR